MSFIQILDVLGTIVFAISGAQSAMNKRFDLFGILIIAAVTAIGGGTLRDLLIGAQPVAWIQTKVYPFAILVGYLFALIFRNKLAHIQRAFFFFDAVGLAIFTIIGLEKGLRFGIDPSLCVVLGMMTGAFGGVIRDILCTDVPLIFHKEIYALASVAGGVLFLILKQFNLNINFIYASTVLVVILIRIFVVRYNIGLPIPTYDAQRTDTKD